MGFDVALTLMASSEDPSREIKVLQSDTVCEIRRRGREIRGWPTAQQQPGGHLLRGRLCCRGKRFLEAITGSWRPMN